jgi:hypothetical protein
VAVGGDALCSGTGDNAGTPGQRGGRRGDNHLATCYVRPCEGVGSFLAAWHPRDQPAVEVGQEVFAWDIARRPRGTQLDGGAYLRRFETVCVKRPGSAPIE